MSESDLSGLDFLLQFVDGKPAPFGALLGFTLTAAEFGKVVFEGTPDARHYNPAGVVHGGYAAGLLDSAMGCAVQSTLAPGISYTTMEIKINLVRAMTEDTGLVRGTGRSIYTGRRSATAEGRLEDSSGKLIAHGTTTCMILS